MPAHGSTSTRSFSPAERQRAQQMLAERLGTVAQDPKDPFSAQPGVAFGPMIGVPALGNIFVFDAAAGDFYLLAPFMSELGLVARPIRDVPVQSYSDVTAARNHWITFLGGNPQRKVRFLGTDNYGNPVSIRGYTAAMAGGQLLVQSSRSRHDWHVVKPLPEPVEDTPFFLADALRLGRALGGDAFDVRTPDDLAKVETNYQTRYLYDQGGR